VSESVHTALLATPGVLGSATAHAASRSEIDTVSAIAAANALPARLQHPQA
jgi:hypothetical protein